MFSVFLLTDKNMFLMFFYSKIYVLTTNMHRITRMPQSTLTKLQYWAFLSCFMVAYGQNTRITN